MIPPLSDLEVKDFVSFALGGGGLFLSLAIWIRTILRERRSIDVKVSPTLFVLANGEVSTQIASIDVINRGSRPVSVKAPTLYAPNKQHLSFVGMADFKKFPRRLEDGESASLSVTFAELADALKKLGQKGTVKLYPACLDATGTRHWGKKWYIDVYKDWMRRPNN
jgi:hypothetical protein